MGFVLGFGRVITFGTFDLFHVGHLNILRRAKELGEHLIVGVSTDDLNMSKKGRFPIIPQDERLELVRACRYVDDVFYEESLEKKGSYILEHGADCLVMGDDWRGRFDQFGSLCAVKYLPRTDRISTTYLEQFIKERDPAVLERTRLSAGSPVAPTRAPP